MSYFLQGEGEKLFGKKSFPLPLHPYPLFQNFQEKGLSQDWLYHVCAVVSKSFVFLKVMHPTYLLSEHF